MSEASLSIGRQRVGVFKNVHVEKMALNIRMQWIAGIACVSECVLKTLACQGLRVGPSKFWPRRGGFSFVWVMFRVFLVFMGGS